MIVFLWSNIKRRLIYCSQISSHLLTQFDRASCKLINRASHKNGVFPGVHIHVMM